MTEAQASRVNAGLGRAASLERWLSPRQLELWRAIRAHPEAGWPEALGTPDLDAALARAREVAARLDT